MSKKVMIAFGTRPEAIKMCPLVKELQSFGANAYVCVTGQHRELLDGIADIFGVRVDCSLELMRRGQSLSSLVSRIISAGAEVIVRERPDIVVVHGDTATAFGMTLAAFFANIRVAHIEAGLRSGNVHEPFPEEFIRRSVTLAAELHFAPTASSAANLIEEGISASKIFVTGNTVVDALKYTLKNDYTHELLDACRGKRIIFLTAHRRENQDGRLDGMLGAVRRICERFEDVKFICPVHPSPTVQNAFRRVLGDCERVLLTPPLGVLDCHNIMARSCLLLTDSGGLQEEGAAMGKPVLVMRNVTERPEGIMSGVACLVGTDTEQIYTMTSSLLDNEDKYAEMASAANPYGDGRAAQRVAEALLEHL